jgi:hypothetical protein
MKEATIIGFYGSWSSGLATLRVIEDGQEKDIPCDNAPTVRALDAMFPGFIMPGHVITNAAIRGKKIKYCMDDMGIVLGGLDYA